jgi:hypothetical protein
VNDQTGRRSFLGTALRFCRLQSVSPCSEGVHWDNGRLGIQIDEAKARTRRVIHYVPLAIVVDVRTVGSFGTHSRQWLWPDLTAVTAHPPIPRRDIDSLEATSRKFDVYVVPAVMQHLTPVRGTLFVPDPTALSCASQQ